NIKSLLGYNTRKELEKQVRKGFVHPQDQQAMRDFWEALKTQRRVYANPFRGKHANGSWVWIECIGTNALDDENVNGIVLNSRDVTARIVNEQRMREIDARFSAIAKATSDVIYEYDLANAHIYLAGSGSHSLFGYEFEQNTAT